MSFMQVPGTILPDWAAPLALGKAVVLDDVTNAQYHGAKALVSKGQIDAFELAPEHYFYQLHHAEAPEERTEALITGAAFHSLVLEPHVFRREYVPLKDFGSMRSSKNRELRDAWLQHEHPGKQPLTQEQMFQITGMREAMFKVKRIRQLMENGRPEVTAAAICPQTRLPRKCRFDWLCELDATGVDLKSALSGYPPRWMREAISRSYHVQDVFYTDTGKLAGIDIDVMAFVVVEKTPPFVCGIHLIPEAARIVGEQRYINALHGIKRCIERNEFPGYGNGEIIEQAWPKYALEMPEIFA